MNCATCLPTEIEPTTVELLATEFEAIRRQTETLVAPLSAEDAQIQSMLDASPAKWHLAHTTWFFETFVLERYEPNFVPFDDAFRVLFNSYYQGVGDQFPRHQRGLVTQPSLYRVLQYRHQIDNRVREVLRRINSEPGLMELIALGLNHEQQHQELLLTDIKHAFFANPYRAPYLRRHMTPVNLTAARRWMTFTGGVALNGHQPEEDGSFAFDNEMPRHRVFLEPFQLASQLVTNGEYVDFINDGGYERTELWLSAGWAWVRQLQDRVPFYWTRDPLTTDTWQHHTLHGRQNLNLEAPVCHLSLFEADAYARWAGARLPTEFEWEHAARFQKIRPSRGCNLAHTGIFEPQPPSAPAALELSQMFGDVWEWTSSSYGAYPGYRPAPGTVGEYNGKFMCNQYVLRGGSCATPLDHIRASYRNFFPTDARWQFTGLRLARSE